MPRSEGRAVDDDRSDKAGLAPLEDKVVKRGSSDLMTICLPRYLSEK